MKYSVNYYSKRNRDFKDTHIQVPQIFETTAVKEMRTAAKKHAAEENSRHQFVVPWQMP